MKRLLFLLVFCFPLSVEAQQAICLDEATAANRRVPIRLVDVTDGETPETSVTLSGADIQISINGAAFTDGLGSVTEIGLGNYYYEYHADEVAAVGFRLLAAEESGVSKVFTGYHVIKPCVTKEEIADTTIVRAFTQDSGEVYGDAVAGSLVSEIGENAGGGGSTDWTTGEKEQIRSALGVDGDKTTAASGQLQALDAVADTIAAAIIVIDGIVDDILVDTSTGVGIADGTLTAAKFANDFLTAAKIASDVGTEIGTATWATTTRQLTGTQTFNLTGNVTGNLSGSVGSVAAPVEIDGIDAATALKIAAFVARTPTSEIEDASYDDLPTLGCRSLYGVMAQQMHRSQTINGEWVRYKSDDIAELCTTDIQTDPAAAPMTGQGAN